MEYFSKYSDSELVTLFREGSDAAFKEIYERYYRLLFLYAVKKLRSKEEAMDVVQEVFTVILSNRVTLNLTSTLSGYLYKSVLNRIFDIFRHKNVIRKYVENGEHYIDVDSSETDYLIREKDIAALIQKEIASMPAKMRAIYEMKYNDLRRTKDIADALGISEHTVSTQLKRAAKHLKSRLGVFIFLIYLINR
jgi:RNA polymerase sigma-70 factor (family 1)